MPLLTWTGVGWNTYVSGYVETAIGPGSIDYAHTSEERVPKKELLESVSIYRNMVKRLLTTPPRRMSAEDEGGTQ